MTSKFKPLEKWILLILLFLLPSQLAYHFWPQFAFVFGIRVDYLAPTVYLTDILVVALLVKNFDLFRRHARLLGFIFILGLINTLFSTLPSASFFRWVKIFEMAAFALYVAEQKAVKLDEIYKVIFYSTIFFSLIGVFQFVVGSTLGRLFYLFGERSFSVSTPGIALTNVWGKQFLRAYSTFSHPNSLAGYLGIVLILSSAVRNKTRWFLVGWLIVVLGFVLTFSLTAYCAMVLIYALFSVTKNSNIFRKATLFLLTSATVFSVALPIAAETFLLSFRGLPSNIYQRIDLAVVSGKMISHKFLLGEGLNTFVFAATKIKGAVTYSWLMQPVHNIYLLIFSELGIMGLLGFSLLLYKLLSRALAPLLCWRNHQGGNNGEK